MAATQVSRRGARPDSLRRRRRAPGFTILELVVALAIVALLLALALPGYQRYQQRAERAEAVRQLLAAAACQERLRADTGYFDTTRCLDSMAGGAYALRFEPAAQTTSLSFTVIAEPTSAGQAGDCGSLSLDQAGTRGIGGDGRVGDCWGGR